MKINLEFDAAALAAPQGFRDAIQQAANIIDGTFTDAITVNIAIGYGELQGTSLPSGGAETETLRGRSFFYTDVRSHLLTSAQANVLSGVQALPSTSSLQGHNSVLVWSGIGKALGLISANDSTLDAAVGFATDIFANSPNLLVGVALHELTHAMGRASGSSSSVPTVFDLYRYTGLGTHLFGSTIPGSSSYFSLDGGRTDLADYGTGSDPSDLLNNGKAPYDPFEEYYVSGTHQYLTALDIEQMEALGFHTTAAPGAQAGFSAGPNLYWENTSGMLSLWELDGFSATGVTLPSASGWQVQDVGDFNGDGLKADLLLRNTTTGMVDVWTDTAGRFSGHDVAQATLDWQIMGTADFNGDGKSDVLWRNEQNGYVSVWQMNGSSVSTTYNPGVVGLQWHVIGAGDYVGDGKAEVLWRDQGTGEVNLWTIDGPGAGQTHGQTVGTLALEWAAVGQGDFNGDGRQDVLWHDNVTGQVMIWEMNGPQILAQQAIASLGSQWKVAAVIDANSDGKADIVWRDSGSGQAVLWDMNGFGVSHAAVLGTVDNAWQTINHHYDWV